MIVVRGFPRVVLAVNSSNTKRMVQQLSTAADGKRHLQIPTGKYSVGVTDLIVKATNLLVRCYYPCSTDPSYTESQSSRWAKWYPSREYADGMARFKFGHIPLLAKLTVWATHDPYVPVVEGSNLVGEDDGKAYPLIVFSHGMGGNRIMYSSLLCQLASEGYFIAAVEHKDHSAVATFTVDDKGNQEWFYNRTIAKGEDELPIRQEQVKTRVKECVQVLDLMERLNRGESEEFHHFVPSQEFLDSLKSKLDTNQPVISGHSFGGATMVKALLEKNSKFKIGLGLDTWTYPVKGEDSDNLAANLNSGQQSSDKPKLLFINCEKFQGESNLATMSKFEFPISDTMETNVLTLKNAVHYAPTDIPTIFMGSYARKPFEFIFGSGKQQQSAEEALNVEEQLEAFKDLSKAFLTYSTASASHSADSPSPQAINCSHVEKLSESFSRWDKHLIKGADYLRRRKESESASST